MKQIQLLQKFRLLLCQRRKWVANVSFDMQAYMDYFGGKLQDQDYDEGEVAMALSNLPSFQG